MSQDLPTAHGELYVWRHELFVTPQIAWHLSADPEGVESFIAILQSLKGQAPERYLNIELALPPEGLLKQAPQWASPSSLKVSALSAPEGWSLALHDDDLSLQLSDEAIDRLIHAVNGLAQGCDDLLTNVHGQQLYVRAH